MADKKEMVLSIEGAAFQVEQELYDESDPGAHLVATVHKTDTGSAGNVWYKPTTGDAYRIIPEREITGFDPDPFTLAGEALRLVEEKQKVIESGNTRVKLAIFGLQAAALHLIDQQKKG